jgi:hypothetical protein
VTAYVNGKNKTKKLLENIFVTSKTYFLNMIIAKGKIIKIINK